MGDSLGDRMKDHEKRARVSIGKGQPVIMRIDGKAFHTYTKGCERPFDPNLINAMNECAKALCKEIQGAQMAYVQSDEISILIHGYKKRKWRVCGSFRRYEACSFRCTCVSTA
jgi:tRNA(His) 5'-end guanylyltransferase